MASRVHRKRRPLLPSGSLFLLAAAVWYLGHSFWPHRTPARLDAYTQLSLHGRVTKHGPVVGLAQLSALFTGIDNPDPNMASALYYPGDWRQQRLAGKRPPPPGRLCAIMWNDALKVIFVKNVKAAGSTLVTYFKDCAVMGPNDGPFEWRCLRTLNFGNATQVEHLMRVWDDYFVFSFGRNVLVRSLSQFRYLAHFMQPSCTPAWDDYCRDPYVLGDICEVHAQNGSSCCDPLATSVHQYLHAMPQAPCMVTEAGQPAVDFIGRVESFTEDFAELLKQLNARPGAVHLPPPGEEMATININNKCQQGSSSSKGKGRKDKGGGGRAGKARGRRPLHELPASDPCNQMEFYSNEHAHCYQHILSFYDEDVRLLMS